MKEQDSKIRRIFIRFSQRRETIVSKGLVDFLDKEERLLKDSLKELDEAGYRHVEQTQDPNVE